MGDKFAYIQFERVNYPIFAKKIKKLRKIIWACLLAVFLGGSVAEMACTRKTSLQKKTRTYQKKVRKGKSIPCPCND